MGLVDRWAARLFRAGAAWVLSGALAACGGGGGGSSSPGTPSSLNNRSSAMHISVTPTELNVTYVQGNSAVSGYLATTVTGDPADGYWGSAEEVSTGNAVPVIEDGYSSDTETGQGYMVWFRTDLAPGTYDSSVKLQACIREACDDTERDATTSLAVHYTVLPNIGADTSSVTLSRTGSEAAPSQQVALTLPPQAGELAVSVDHDSYDTTAVTARLDGHTLTVSTSQARAGTYTATVHLNSTTDARFHLSLPVTYTVLPPPGGEVGLRLSTDVSPDTGTGSSLMAFAANRGDIVTHTIHIENPTWSSAPPTFTWVNGAGPYQVTDLGQGQYRISFDTRGLSGSQYNATLKVSVSTEDAYIDAFGSVNNNFLFDAPGGFIRGVSVLLMSDSQPDAMSWQGTVAFKSLSAPVHTWHAQGGAPWFTLNRTSGEIGTDTLTITLDKNLLLQGGAPDRSATVHITADGTTDTLDIPVGFTTAIPQLQQPLGGPIVGTRGTLRLRATRTADMLRQADSLLVVSGARVLSRKAVTQWNLGGYEELLLDVDQAQPGQAITVRWNSAVLPSQVSVPVVAVPAVSAGSKALPFGPRRGIVVHPVTGDVYFADGDTVWRGHLAQGSWAWQSVAINHLTDVSVSADGAKVFALATDAVYGLNPTTLAVVSQGSWPASASAIPDAQTPAWHHALVTPADGETYVALASKANPAQGGETWLRGALSGDPLDISVQPGGTVLGLNTRDDGYGARSLVSSASGRTVLIVHPAGTVYVHTADVPSLESWANQPALVVPGSPLPAGVNVAAVADAQRLFIRNDGVVQSMQTALGAPLSTRLPAGWSAGGYGLTADGQRALVYGYRLDRTNPDQPVAAEAAVFVFDTSMLPAKQASEVVQLAQIAVMPLGCTGTLAAGETCAHEAAITVSADGRGAYLVGPRGLAIITLDAAAMPSRAGRVKAASARTAFPLWQSTTRVPNRP